MWLYFNSQNLKVYILFSLGTMLGRSGKLSKDYSNGFGVAHRPSPPLHPASDFHPLPCFSAFTDLPEALRKD